ncbi:hypothetical protein LINGRAHAP2_LOCUS17967, partial [Linum grandiflorum]
FSYGTLLTETKGSSPSWGWLSILHGRELLLQGSRWMVGTGTYVSILSDNWLPSTPPVPPSKLPLTSPLPSMVSDLIHNGAWNEPLLHSCFTPSPVALISSIPLPITRVADDWVWRYTNDGLYSVPSGYRLAQSIRVLTSLKFDPPLVNSWLWATVWGSPIQPKLKFLFGNFFIMFSLYVIQLLLAIYRWT